MHAIKFQLTLLLLVPGSLVLVVRRSYRVLGKYWNRRTSGCCELKRIYNKYTNFGFSRTRRLEVCLARSKRPKIREISDELRASLEEGTFEDHTQRMTIIKLGVDLLADEKGIHKCRDDKFLLAFQDSLNTIWSYRWLAAKVETLRSTEFESDLDEHEEKIIGFWTNMFPNDQLEGRISKQWQVLGFQSANPVTDLRGAGFLGVECMLYFSGKYNDLAKCLLLRSYHPQLGFPFACVSIQITFWAYHLVVSGLARTHFYNAMEEVVEMDAECWKSDILHDSNAWVEYNQDWESKLMAVFYDFYVIIFTKFVKYWIDSEPKNIMDFGKVKKAFEAVLTKTLENPSCRLEKVPFEPEKMPAAESSEDVYNDEDYYDPDYAPLISESEHQAAIALADYGNSSY